MTETQILQWIKDNLSPIINKAITVESPIIYTEDWLAGIVCRETGILISKYAPKDLSLESISSLMRGDYSQRKWKGETSKRYHGFSFFQIDVDSFPDFVSSGQWKDPYLSCLKAINVLESKRKYLQARFKLLSGEELDRAITASYNAGEGNISKSLLAGEDIDSRTANHNYSKEVWRFRDEYKKLGSVP